MEHALQHRSSTGASILVIDDHEDNLALLDELLASRGFRVWTALDGPTGLQVARERHPDLILLDLAMPGMDGFEVLLRLRDDRLTSRIPVIILTANFRDPAMIDKGLSLGATEYLTKPIQTEELVVRLRGALRLSEVERQLEQLRRDFASMLVHDMRAPLEGVRLVLATLKQQEDEQSAKRGIMEDALVALENVGDLMDELLQANRLEDESFSAKLQTVRLADVVEKSLRALRPVAEVRHLGLVAEGVDGVPEVVADPALLKRVIDNLIGNALKFTQAGEIRVEGRLEAGQLRVSIRDTGPGIPTDELGRIFDRYFHIARRQQTRYGSLGLGLAFCEQAVGAMNGRIGVFSEEGRGSEFWFTLPIAGAAH